MFFKKNKKKFEQFYKDFFNSFEEGKILASFINFFPDGILFLDKKQKITLINSKAKEILKIKRNNIFGKNPLALGEFENFKPLIPFLGEKKEKPFKKEIQIKENFFLSISIIPIFSEGRFLGTVAILKDISENKLLEKAKTDFVTLAAHQFRTPTSAIKWSLSMLLEEDHDLKKEQRKTIEKTYKVNNKMIALVNDLLDFAKIKKGEQFFQPSLSQIEDFVLEITQKNKERIEKKDLDLLFEKPQKPLPKLMTDPIKIKIAIENILDNAIRYTPEKGKIKIYFKQEEKEVSVFVKDTGLGIPASQQQRVFSYFFRGSNILQVHTEGVGLGL